MTEAEANRFDRFGARWKTWLMDRSPRVAAAELCMLEQSNVCTMVLNVLCFCLALTGLYFLPDYWPIVALFAALNLVQISLGLSTVKRMRQIRHALGPQS